jgi:hypothetical protein
VQYSVVPVVGPSKDKLSLDTGNASPLTLAMTITGQSTPHISSFFNKGIVAAQWVARELAAAYAINIIAIYQTYHWNSYVFTWKRTAKTRKCGTAWWTNDQ